MHDRRIVEVPLFGQIEMADGDIFVQDGGTGGVDGHAVRVSREGQGTWELRTGELDAIRGTFEPSEHERRTLATWADAAWVLCANPKPTKRISTPPPRWVWCVIVRRGNEARWLMDRDDAPEEMRPLLDWLVKRVDALAGFAGKTARS